MSAIIYIVGRSSDITSCKFKIGLTTDFFNRLHNYATGAPPDDQFTIYKTYQISPPNRLRDIEQYIHASFNSYNMDGDRIPEQICVELSTTLYSQYAKFVKFLKINNISDVASYLRTREKYSWMPSIETLQIKYPKFGFVVLGHPNNASYYQTKTEYENAYQKALKHIDCDDYMPDELIKQVLAYDRKLHPLKDLFYPKV